MLSAWILKYMLGARIFIQNLRKSLKIKTRQVSLSDSLSQNVRNDLEEKWL